MVYCCCTVIVVVFSVFSLTCLYTATLFFSVDTWILTNPFLFIISLPSSCCCICRYIWNTDTKMEGTWNQSRSTVSNDIDTSNVERIARRFEIKNKKAHGVNILKNYVWSFEANSGRYLWRLPNTFDTLLIKRMIPWTSRKDVENFNEHPWAAT